ncbi:MAG: hypothetical protein AAF558_07945 [Verrucomicrobiota bacterium]
MEPWFDGNAAGALIGSGLGIAGAIEGCMGSFLMLKGKLRRLVLGFHYSLILICSCILIFGVFAYFQKQPTTLWLSLLIPGGIGVSVWAALTPEVLKRYREAELRKVAALEL